MRPAGAAEEVEQRRPGAPRLERLRHERRGEAFRGRGQQDSLLPGMSGGGPKAIAGTPSWLSGSRPVR
ncbi:hypothetical protein ABZU76_08435 [Amycolatopsis sp. NPDC005232]|uniref:hypothetical protein n=1 Tax=Amycolatopsis sp. NPDC005232 TaxID=3157027 RepID=UPI0033ABEEF0